MYHIRRYNLAAKSCETIDDLNVCALDDVLYYQTMTEDDDDGTAKAVEETFKRCQKKGGDGKRERKQV